MAGDAARWLDGERRIVTVLISDLSGFTAMGERLDPESVADIMRMIKRDGAAIIEAHGGTVNQFIGDEIVSLFGLPTARDDDARRAVAAALALHERVDALNDEVVPGNTRVLAMHSGIQTGLVIARVDDERNGVYELTGDTINTAARLLSLATRGDVLIGDATLELVRGLVEVEDAGSHEVRGKARPITAHRVTGSRDEHSRFDRSRETGLTPLAGRGGELAELHDAAREAFSGSGGSIVVEGEAGTGKSRLCHEFVSEVTASRPEVAVLQGRCQAYGSVTPYLPFVQLVRETLGLDRRAAASELRTLVPDAVARLDPGLSDRVPAFLHLLAAATIDELPEHWRGDRLPEVLQTACVDLVRAVASARPCIVKLDDWHWADSASRLTLVRLLESVGTIPAMVLIAQRPNTADGEARIRRRVHLDALGAVHTRQMVCDHFGVGAVQDELASRIHDRTLGNPLFVEEVCAALRASASVEVIDDRLVTVSDPEQVAIPATVQAVLLGRIDALPAEPKRTIRAASVIGREFSVAALHRIVRDRDLDDHLQLLQERGHIEPMDDADERRYRFRHVIAQSVTYDSLLVKDRADVHRTIARIIEDGMSDDDHLQQRHVEALAHHHLGAGDHRRAVEYLEAAGTKAWSRFAVAEARARFGHAIEVSLLNPDDNELRRARTRIAVRWAESCVYEPSLEQVARLQDVLGEAIADGELERAVLLGYWINWLQHSIGDQTAAETGTRLMLDQVRGNEQITEVLDCLLGMILATARRPAEALVHLERGMRRRDDAYRNGETHQAASGMHVYTLAQCAIARADAGDLARARRDAEYALSVTRDVGVRLTEGSVQICRALVGTLAGDWSDVRSAVAEILRLDPVVISGHVRRMSDILDAFATIQLGAVHEVERLERAVAALRESDQRLALGLGEALLADALVDAGRPGDARVRAMACLARRACNDRYGDDIAEAVLVRICGLDGSDLERRITETLHSTAVADNPRSRALLELASADALRSAGDERTALGHVDSAIEAMTELDLTGWLQRAHGLRAMLA